jgi:parallel beta-helix repeat protein
MSLFGVAALAPADPLTFYVSPAGDDAWSGKLAAPNARRTDGPFATLAGARDGVRKTRPEGQATTWATVQVRGGKYCLDETLTFTPRDDRLSFAACKGGKPQIIGGRFISGLKPGPQGVWSVALPAVKEGKWSFRSLFVDGKRLIRARQPNFDLTDPYRKGFLYAARDASAFGISVGCIHNVGDWMEYKITVPADGEYALWTYYGAENKPFGNDNMGGRTVMKVDGGRTASVRGEGVLLQNLPDTGGWGTYKWTQNATLKLTAGEHVLHWENLKGGGLDLEAFALSNDPAWLPADTRLPAVAAGKHLLLIQAEGFVASHGPQLAVGGSGSGEKDRFYYGAGDLQPRWAQAPGAEVHIFQTGNCRAFKELCFLSGIDPEERLVTLTGPECTSTLHAGDRYFVENVRDLLDAPGEWYLDQPAGMLYLMPPKGFSEKSEVMAPTVGRIIEAPEGADGLSFTGLTFRGGDWSFDDGCVGYGMGTNGVIYLKDARKCAITNCTFTNLGKDAVCLEAGGNNIVSGNDITDSAEGGLNINGGKGNVIEGNHIHHLGQVYKHNGGITLQNGASDNTVRGNIVHDVTRYGITMKMAGHDNLIEHNRVLNTSLETFDTGAIEVTQQDRDDRSGTKIIGNIVGDTVGYSSTGDKPCFLSWGIYLDSFAGGYTVANNVVYRSQHGGIMFQGGKDNRVYSNILVDGQVGQGHISNFAKNQTGCALERNIIAFSNPQALLFASGALTPEVIRVDRNVYFCPGLTEYRPGYSYKTFADWQQAGFDVNSVLADPLFVNAAQDDYRLKPESPAFKLGFERADLGQVPSCKCHIEKLAPVFFESKPWPRGYR